MPEEGLTVTFSDVQGGFEGEGNIDAEPVFIDPEEGDYHLTEDSPSTPKTWTVTAMWTWSALPGMLSMCREVN